MRKQLNKWQEHFVSTYFNGKMPTDVESQTKLALLGEVDEFITVHFPSKEATVIKGITFPGRPAHTETFKVSLTECDMPNGVISVETLASNLYLWAERGYKMEMK